MVLGLISESCAFGSPSSIKAIGFMIVLLGIICFLAMVAQTLISGVVLAYNFNILWDNIEVWFLDFCGCVFM